MAQRHFRLVHEGLYSSGDFLSPKRSDADVWFGDEDRANEIAEDFYTVEWFSEGEEMIAINAPRLPGI